MTNALFKLLQAIGRRDWIRFGIRRRLVRACWKRFGHDFPFETQAFGMRYAGNLKDYIDRCVYFYGAYEKSLLALLRERAEHVSSGAVFVDVGANVGQHSLFISRLCKEVHAFEPVPMNLERLRHNLELNSIPNVHVHPCGLGDTAGYFPFRMPPERDAGIGTFLDAEHDAASRKVRKLSVVMADDYFAKHQIRPDIIKMDVEGFEAKVLVGMRKILTTSRPVVVLEFSPMLRDQLEDQNALENLFPYPVRIHRIVSFGSWRYGLDEFHFEPSDILVEPVESGTAQT